MKRSIVAGVAAALWLAACGTPPPGPGTARDDVLRDWGRPTARHTLPMGAERLEYASGPYGRTTWMIDIDASGRVVQARQVLTEAEFMQVQVRAAGGLTRDELLRWIGRPGERRHGGWAGGEVWSWRYPTNDCLWFQVSVADSGAVGGGAFAIDPVCDAPNDRD
ncbi:MAG: hypothetical protein Q7S90_00635 [Rubrivivax sp.]|nr:hypothetical protein [Rubrivivax sp.]